MSTFINNLGLSGGANAGNLGPYHLIFHFFWAYVILAPRAAKNYFKIDHNAEPRSDIIKYGQRAVSQGKLTQRQLNFLNRNEAAHLNSLENLPFFIAAVLFATVAGVEPAKINNACAVYTAMRITFGVAYLATESYKLSYIRTAAWWTANIACIRLLWAAGKALSTAS